MPQQQPRRRTAASDFNLITLACTVVLAAALPIAATAAGAAHRAEAGGPVPAHTTSSSTSTARSATSPTSPTFPKSSSSSTSSGASSSAGRATAADGAPASCGPELSAPEGLSAQTCVLSVRGSTWARTYYRNGTGSPLSAALTLLRPDGTSLRADCEVTADRGTSVCETPREKSRAGGRAYAATGEAGSADGERLLLRSGSNSPGE